MREIDDDEYGGRREVLRVKEEVGGQKEGGIRRRHVGEEWVQRRSHVCRVNGMFDHSLCCPLSGFIDLPKFQESFLSYIHIYFSLSPPQFYIAPPSQIPFITIVEKLLFSIR